MAKRLVTPKKKLTPKSIASRPRKEAFLPTDASFLGNMHSVKLGKKINEGTEGAVYELADNRHLVIKVPKGYKSDIQGRTSSENRRIRENRLHETKQTNQKLRTEAYGFEKLGFNEKPLIIPTHIVNLGSNDLNNGDYIGLIRPKIKTLVDFHGNVDKNNIKRLTRSQIELIRQKLIELSEQGYAFSDGLQIGLDVAGRPLIYDLGKMEKFSYNNPQTFKINNEKWMWFLMNIGKLPAYGDYQDELKKYGEIEQRQASNWW